MPTYFFHTYDGGHFVDQVGTDLPNAAKAHGEAVRLAGAMLNQNPQLLFAGRTFRTEVVDEAGTSLFTVVAQTVSGAASEIAS